MDVVKELVRRDLQEKKKDMSLTPKIADQFQNIMDQQGITVNSLHGKTLYKKPKYIMFKVENDSKNDSPKNYENTINRQHIIVDAKYKQKKPEQSKVFMKQKGAKDKKNKGFMSPSRFPTFQPHKPVHFPPGKKNYQNEKNLNMISERQDDEWEEDEDQEDEEDSDNDNDNVLDQSQGVDKLFSLSQKSQNLNNNEKQAQGSELNEKIIDTESQQQQNELNDNQQQKSGQKKRVFLERPQKKKRSTKKLTEENADKNKSNLSIQTNSSDNLNKLDVSKSIFNRKTIEALQVADGDSQNDGKLFGVGPRYDQYGELLQYSIIGKSDWFNKSEGKLVGKGGRAMRNSRHPSKLTQDDRRSSVLMNTTSTSLSRRQSYIGKGPAKLKKSDMDKVEITKQQLLWNLQKIDSQIRQREMETAREYQLDSVIQIPTSSDLGHKTLRNMAKNKQMRTLNKYDEQTEIWEETASKLATVSDRILGDTLLLRSSEYHRQKCELKDLLQKTKESSEIIGDCYWESTLRENEKRKPLLDKFGIPVPEFKMKFLTETNGSLIRTHYDQNNYELIRKPLPLSSSMTTFRKTTEKSSISNQNTNNANYLLTSVSNLSLSNNNNANNPSSNKNNFLQTSKSFNKSLPHLNMTSFNLTSTNLFQTSFESKMSKKRQEQKQNFNNIFNLEIEDIMVQGESKLGKERKCLLGDGLPSHQLYYKIVQPGDENIDSDPFTLITNKNLGINSARKNEDGKLENISGINNNSQYLQNSTSKDFMKNSGDKRYSIISQGFEFDQRKYSIFSQSQLRKGSILLKSQRSKKI